MPTMDTMDTHMLTMDITMARDLLMLKPMLMLTMVPMDMDMVLPTMVMDMAMVMHTTDTDTMLMATMDMPPTDTMDTHML